MALFQSLENPLAMAAMLAGIAIVCWVLLRRSHRYFGRRPTGGPTIVRSPRPSDHDAHHGSFALPEEMARWEVDMSDLARELSAQLDSKMSILQALIQDADRAASRLEAARAGATSEPDVLRSAEEHRAEIHTMADYGFTPTDIASRLQLAVAEVERILRQRAKVK